MFHCHKFLVASPLHLFLMNVSLIHSINSMKGLKVTYFWCHRCMSVKLQRVARFTHPFFKVEKNESGTKDNDGITVTSILNP